MDAVTIAIPVYNGAQYLSEAISSALQQSVPADELVVWDNASTDDSVEIARSLLSPSGVRRSERNLGAAANFDRAAVAATTEWFMWLAADDRLHPDYLEACLSAVAAAAAPCRAVLTGIRYIDAEGREKRTQVDLELGDSRLATRARHFSRKSRWTESYCLYRTAELKRSPRFTPEYGTDVLLTWWFILRGPLLIVDRCLLEYREASQRTVEEMAASLMVTDDHAHWRKVRLYRRMWDMARASDISTRATWTARRELLLASLSTVGANHLEEAMRLRLVSLETRRGRPASPANTALLRLGLLLTEGRRRISRGRNATS